MTFNPPRFSIAICRIFPSTGELSQAAASLCQEVGVYLHASRGPGQVSELGCHGNTGNYNACCKVIYTQQHKVQVHPVSRLHFWSILLSHLTVWLYCWSASSLRPFISQEGVELNPTISTLECMESKGGKGGGGWSNHVSVPLIQESVSWSKKSLASIPQAHFTLLSGHLRHTTSHTRAAQSKYSTFPVLPARTWIGLGGSHLKLISVSPPAINMHTLVIHLVLFCSV